MLKYNERIIKEIAMTPEIKGYISAVLYVVVLVAVALVLYKLGMPRKFTRKLVHILVGFEWIMLSHFMGPTIHFLIVCLAFTAVLVVSHLLKLLPALSSDEENAPGTVYYGVAMSIMSLVMLFLPEMLVPFGIGVFCTSLGDGLAGVVGQLVKKHNPKIYRNKSLFGTVTNFAVSTAVALTISHIFDLGLGVWYCISIGILSAGLELIGAWGLDNITVTLGVSFFSYALVNFDATAVYIVPILVTPLMIAAVVGKRALTGWGLVGALVIDLVVSITFGNFGFVALMSFFGGALVVDKIKKRRKKEDTITKKEGTRDLVQVVANGLVPLVMTVLYICTLEPAFIVGYVAALAEAFADTVASGLGVYSKTTFDIFKMKKCECGISGGMSVVGTLSSFVASIIIALIPFAFGLYGMNLWPVVIAALAAFGGAIFDSFLGSVLQIKYTCRVCGALTEREMHCNSTTVRHSGFAFFDNDVVNLLSGLFAATLASALTAIFI